MNYLFFDTETTGFPNPKVLPTSKLQARVCQLAALLVDDKFNELGRLNSLVKPAGWKIAQGAFEAHGISLEDCEKEGKPIDEVLAKFLVLGLNAENTVCHNANFDNTMLEIECANVFDRPECLMPQTIMDWLDNRKIICTMELTTNVCRLPFKGRSNFGKKYKWPTLQEAHEKLLGSTFDDAHDAMADVEACVRVFKYLVENNLYTTPSQKVLPMPTN